MDIQIYFLQAQFDPLVTRCLDAVTTDPVCMVVSVQRDGTGRPSMIVGPVCMVVSVQRDGTGRPSMIVGPVCMVYRGMEQVGVA